MKLNKNKKDIMYAIKKVNALVKLDAELNDKFKPFDKYPDISDAWWFFDYCNTLNIIYIAFTGESERAVYDRFQCSKYDKYGKPIGWYTTQYNTKGDGSIPGPEGYSGFIPDKINDVILNKKLTSTAKYGLLKRMFGDLAKIEEVFNRRKKK